MLARNGPYGYNIDQLVIMLSMMKIYCFETISFRGLESRPTCTLKYLNKDHFITKGQKEGRLEIARVIPREDDDYESQLKKALEALCELAIEEGAHECAVIECEDLVFRDVTTDTPDIPVEERSIFWPVPRFPNDSIQDAIRQYRWAVVFRLNLDDENSEEEERGHDGRPSGHHYSENTAKERIFKVAGLVEAASFYKGFYLAIGLAAGNCKDVFCKTDEKCQALTVGKPCRHPLRPRPSIEACGLDPESIAEKAGWKDFNRNTFLMGMVFID